MHEPQTPPGLDISWRPASLDDAAGLSDLFNAISSFDETPERMSEQSMAHELEAYFDPLADRTVVARTETGAAVAYGTVFHRSTDGSEQRVYVNAYVSPAYRDVGLEDAITDWAIAVGTEVLSAQLAAKKYLTSWFYKKQLEVADRFAARDFAAVSEASPLTPQVWRRPWLVSMPPVRPGRSISTSPLGSPLGTLQPHGNVK